MISLVRPLAVLTASALAALPVDHLVRVLPRGSLSRWPALALTTFLACYLALATPPLALAAVVGLVAVGARRRRMDGAATEPVDAPAYVAVAACAAVLLAAILFERPDGPCFWDAFVWLGKARYAAGGLGELIAGGLRTTLPPFIPSGYPLFEPLSVALLAGLSPRAEAVVAGAVGLEILALALFLCALADDPGASVRAREVRLATATFVLVSSPLVLVHLRSSYVDLPLGFVVAALAQLLPRRRAGVACAVLGMSAAALKDEGMVHVAALGLAGVIHVASGGRPWRDRDIAIRATACVLAAATVMAFWHLRLHQNGISNSDHALAFPDWERVRSLWGLGVEHLLELRSWGALGVLALGAVSAVAVHPRSAPPAARWFATVLTVDAIAMFLALLATPDRVMEFAVGGTLLNRIYMQFAPTAALLVASWVSAAAPSSPFSREGDGLQG